jgi:hypothetical protein
MNRWGMTPDVYVPAVIAAFLLIEEGPELIKNPSDLLQWMYVLACVALIARVVGVAWRHGRDRNSESDPADSDE